MKRHPADSQPFSSKPPDYVVRSSCPQHAFEELAGPGPLALDDLLRRSLGDDGAAAVTALGSQIDDPIR